MSAITVPVQFVRLNIAARTCGVSTSTIRRLCNASLVSCRRTPIGRQRLVNIAECCEVIGVAPPENSNAGKTGDDESGRVVLVYARVSTNKQKVDGNLGRQIERLKAYCAEHYPGQVVKVISEVGSGLSDSRAGYLKMVSMIAAGSVSQCVVEFRDRCARYGVSVIQRLCEAKGTAFVESRTGDEKENELTSEQEMAKDVLAILACYSNRMAAKRGGETVKIVPPPEFRDFVVTLAGSGMSRRDIVSEVRKRQFVCLNTSKILGERPVRTVLESLPATILVPATVKSFIRRRCVVAIAAKESTATLYAAFVVHCNTLHVKPVTQEKWTEYVRESVPNCRIENGRISVMVGIRLKGGC
jgi:predicted site-specific integrase-resolvase